ncbi:ABC transporter permease [Enterococcus sp. HY326]|uniref:ABC transporter permease n=1 Tax=Enterococcus sp. HY326 TaxID=2971265 RepID=UPI0022408055|nr:ABC transporter permease [Enterococcus sp. HY326]
MKGLLKKLLRDIKGNLAQFVTIVLIVAIGAFLYVGLASVAGSLKTYTQDYYEDYQLSDVTLTFSTIDQATIEKIAEEYPSIQTIEGRTSLAGTQTFDDYTSELNIFSTSNNSQLNQSYVVAGNTEIKEAEILIDSDYANAHDYQVGSTMTVTIADQIEELTVAGLIENPEFVMKVAGSDLTPQPRTYGVAYISEEMAQSLSKGIEYNQVLIKADGDRSKLVESISEEYQSSYIASSISEDSTAYSNLQGLITTDESLSKVIPILFFAVAAIITFISMTRLIQQSRTQIGVMKSLGRKPSFIRMYYIMYTFLSSLLGTILGSLGAYFAFIRIGDMQVAAMYALPNYEVTISPTTILPSFLLVFTFGLLAIGLSTRKVLKEKPSELIRQLPPKHTKGILFEKIPFVWQKLSYGNKYIVRNLFLNKKRFFLNLFGLMLSFIMIVFAFGYYNAMNTVVNREVHEVNTYDLNITSAKAVTIERQLQSKYDKLESQQMEVQAIEIGSKSDSLTTTLYVSNQRANLLKTFDSENQVLSDFTDGVVIPEVYATKLGKKVGDFIELTFINQAGLTIKTKITDISTQYSNNFLITSNIYLHTLGIDYTPTTLLISTGDEDRQTALIDDIKAIDADVIYSTNEDIQSNMAAVLSTTVPMVIIFLLCAIFLTIATIYNISSINIFDRNRDIATLKVLGYSKVKVNKLVFKENFMIALGAVVLSLPIANPLFKNFIEALTTDLQSMPTNLPYWILLLAGAIVMSVTFLCNLLLKAKVKNVDMIGVLKSVE